MFRVLLGVWCAMWACPVNGELPVEHDHIIGSSFLEKQTGLSSSALKTISFHAVPTLLVKTASTAEGRVSATADMQNTLKKWQNGAMDENKFTVLARHLFGQQNEDKIKKFLQHVQDDAQFGKSFFAFAQHMADTQQTYNMAPREQALFRDLSPIFLSDYYPLPAKLVGNMDYEKLTAVAENIFLNPNDGNKRYKFKLQAVADGQLDDKSFSAFAEYIKQNGQKYQMTRDEQVRFNDLVDDNLEFQKRKQ